jgi:hypothetical protein
MCKKNVPTEKEKDKANKRILRSLSFDNNGLVKPSCGTVALYGPFGFFKIWQNSICNSDLDI